MDTPNTTPSAARKLNCPNDGSTLNSIIIEEVPVDGCPTCGGYWLQRGELELLAEHHNAHLDPIVVGNIGRADSARRCPEDDSVLFLHEFEEHSGVTIDQCPICQGIWLEAGELSAIMRYLDTGHPGTEPTLTQRIMLFLYQLVRTPPYY